MPRLSIFVFALIAATSITVAAQTTPANSEQSKTANDKAAAAIEAERLLKERRANAQSLLINLAADARNFTDPTVRARTQARIADALWDTDRERSRTMFRSAFDAAEAADAESQARMQEDIRQQQARTGRGGYVIASPPNLRREVLEFAAKRDQKLAEEFLIRYRDQKTREADERGRRNSSGADEATAQRFSVAGDMLEAGDVAKALEFAGPALGSISIPSIDFLSRLRDKDSIAADQRYAGLLQNATMNPQADANTVSILASYIFTPHLYITFQGNGTSSSSMGATPPASVSPELRAGFFRAAAAILLRPVPEQSTAGTDGQYLGIRRMMPLFEQFAPAETTAALKVQLDSLGAMASNSARNRDDEYLHRGISPEPETDKKGDREQALLDQADHAKISAERDQAYLNLAMLMVDKDDRRARDYVDKIDDTELRDGSRGFIDASIAYKVVTRKNVERALEVARNGDLTHLQRSWLLSQTANLIGARDRDGAAQVMEDAAAEARRIETSDPDRPRAFLAIANVALKINRPSVWGIMDDAIRAANSAEKFTGEDGQITFRLISKGTNAVHQHGVDDFNVSGIFVKLAEEDYDKAVELARGFKGEAPRANAVIAIARSVLNEKKK